MATVLNPSEEAQLMQTIEMFEVITQSQPQDYQSLEILKEAYSKLSREKDVVGTSKRIAQAYVQMGQLSSAILEYETILQRYPEDPDVRGALKEIEGKAANFPIESAPTELVPVHTKSPAAGRSQKTSGKSASEIDDGRQGMQQVFVETKAITSGDFDLCWTSPDMTAPPTGVIEPFVQVLSDKGVLPLDKAMKLLADKSRCAYLPLQLYDIDMDLARRFPAATCRRWCVLPFDRMSKSIMVATANPFNLQAAKELSEANGSRLLWYLAPPSELIKNLRKAFH
jgi:hypothetical protein